VTKLHHDYNELENKNNYIKYIKIVFYIIKINIKMLKNYQMYVSETIWESIEWNCTKKNKCIIKDTIRWKIL